MEQIIFQSDEGGGQKVFLILPEKKYKAKRFIGYIHNSVFYCQRNKNKNQIYRHSNTINFNYKLINEGSFDLICVTVNFEELWTSRLRILKSGKFINYSKNYLDKQIGLQLSEFKHSRSEALIEFQEFRELTKKEKTKISSGKIQLCLF